MRRAVTFAVHGNRFELIFDPAIPVSEQHAWIKRAQRDGFACDCIEHWTTDGERRRFHPPVPKVKSPTKKLAKV
jgi:hypothetical protein